MSLSVTGFHKGRIYDLHMNGVRSADGEPLLHGEAYYTLNRIPK